MVQTQGAVQCRLAAHRWQHRIGLFTRDDLFDSLPFNRFYIRDSGRVGVGHDGRRIAVDQNRAIAFGLQGLAGLGPGIVELAGLADDDRAGANDQYAFYVCTLWHDAVLFPCGHEVYEFVYTHQTGLTSEELRGGKECVVTCSYLWSPNQ